MSSTSYVDFLERKVCASPIDPTDSNSHLTLEEWRQEWGSEPSHFVYGLWDPVSGELRYIGKSDRPKERLANQMNETSNTHRCHWLQGLKSRGLRPVQRIIDAVPAGADWQSVEIAYIRGGHAGGNRLTNATAGGDGVSGLSDEAKAKMRSTWLGRKHTMESREKMAAAIRGRRHTEEYKEYMRRIMSERDFTPLHRERIRTSLQKLTNEQVLEVRRLLNEGEVQTAIAAKFNISKASVSNIKQGVTYSHIK